MGNPKRSITNYLITWLCYGDKKAAKRVTYSADERKLAKYDVLIVPNGFLGKEIVLPDLKKPVVEQPQKGKTIIRTDIIYTAFFFISRAEELINPQRDEHGRFLAKHSLLGKRHRLQTPLLDEYARLLMKCLGLTLPKPGFEHVYLTHDIDSIAQYRHLRGAIGGILRGEGKAVCRALCNSTNDPLYTFPWLVKQDARVPNAETIYFVKHTLGKGFDYPQYCLHGKDFRCLKQLLLRSGARLGLHSSYYGQIPNQPSPIPHPLLHRSHFLRCSIQQMQRLVDAGITDDFTMGFADEAGFRLQTTRAVQWINPQTMQLTTLTLHPLMAMDNTLSQANYMHLTEDEAYFLCERLIRLTHMHHGDLCLLWHNSIFTPQTYHRSLYPKLLQLIVGQ